MFSSIKLHSKMLFFNWQTWITCILLTHLDPFLNGVLNTGGIGPKLLGTQNTRAEDTQQNHKNTGGFLWVLSQHRRAEHPLPGMMDTALSQGHLHATEPWPASHQPRPCPEPPFLQPVASKAESREWLEGNCSASSYPSKARWKCLALGLSRTAGARREGQSSWPYSTYQ